MSKPARAMAVSLFPWSSPGRNLPTEDPPGRLPYAAGPRRAPRTGATEGDGMELWELEAREELRQLLTTYYRLGDSGRIAEQAALFEPDGVVELYGRGTFVGPDAIAAAYKGLNENHVADPG